MNFNLFLIYSTSIYRFSRVPVKVRFFKLGLRPVFVWHDEFISYVGIEPHVCSY